MMADLVARRQLSKVTVALDDVQLVDPALASSIEKNAFRYAKLFADAFDKLLPALDEKIVSEDVFDVIQAHRIRLLNASKAPGDTEQTEKELIEKHFPKALFRRFEVRFSPRSEAKAGSLRNVVSTDLGKLVTVKCIVVRASDIKPICVVATYSCESCGYELYQEVSGGGGGWGVCTSLINPDAPLLAGDGQNVPAPAQVQHGRVRAE